MPRSAIEEIYHGESRRVLATLIRLLGDFDLAEEAVQDAFIAALERWPDTGVPDNPRAWLVSTGRFKAIDQLRRRARFDASLAALADRFGGADSPAPEPDDDGVEDDRLRLIFTCCHPALSPDAQLALTLRDVCGALTRRLPPFLSSRNAPQRIRGPGQDRDPASPIGSLAGRSPRAIDAVLHVVYLVFTRSTPHLRVARSTRHDSRRSVRWASLIELCLTEALGRWS